MRAHLASVYIELEPVGMVDYTASCNLVAIINSARTNLHHPEMSTFPCRTSPSKSARKPTLVLDQFDWGRPPSGLALHLLIGRIQQTVG